MLPCTDTTTPTTRIRPLRSGEEHLVRQVVEGMSLGARFLRFHAPTPRLTAATLRALASVEEGVRGAVVALVDGRAVGLAQWARDPAHSRRAELAIAVADAHQGVGLGRTMVARLAEEMPAHAIHELVCLVHHENDRVRQTLRRLGARREPEGALVLPVTALLGDAERTGIVLPWTDAVPGPRTPAGDSARRH